MKDEIFLLREGPPWLGPTGKNLAIFMLKQTKNTVLALKIRINSVMYVIIFRIHNFCYQILNGTHRRRLRFYGRLQWGLNSIIIFLHLNWISGKIDFDIEHQDSADEKHHHSADENTNIMLMKTKGQVCMN